ncbi:MAG TPA: hypothetical protein VFK30_07365 [Anaerolineae bacterium]|nr:hypothetical protein [Anaerolineae bacterium]
MAYQMGAHWTRAWLPWASIETSPGNYDWSWADLQLNHFAEEGLKIIAVIYYPPPWSASQGCGPISDTLALDHFVTAVTTRYGNIVDAWEFINEPDGRAPYYYGPVIGCWGPQPQLYSEQLSLFYHKVKMIDPTALVAFGGLAYDNWTIFDRDFFTHTLESGAGNYFDVLSLHFYPINPQDFPTIADKINEIKAIMQRHGVYNKLIWISETSMWTNNSLDDQKNYIVKDLTRGFCAGADRLFWFDVREGIKPQALKRWLINNQHQPDQGYYTFQHYAAQIHGAFCRGKYTQVPANIEAYNFGTPTGDLYVLWATTGSAVVNLPAGSSATLVDRDGLTSQPLNQINGRVSQTIGTQPVFIVITR